MLAPNLAPFDGVDSTALNGDRTCTIAAPFDGVDSTGLNSGTRATGLALFDGVDSTGLNSGTRAPNLAAFHAVERTASGGVLASGVAVASGNTTVLRTTEAAASMAPRTPRAFRSMHGTFEAAIGVSPETLRA